MNYRYLHYGTLWQISKIQRTKAIHNHSTSIMKEQQVVANIENYSQLFILFFLAFIYSLRSGQKNKSNPYSPILSIASSTQSFPFKYTSGFSPSLSTEKPVSNHNILSSGNCILIVAQLVL